jgi:bla regulator protein blaR1
VVIRPQNQKVTVPEISNELIILDGKEVSKSALNQLSILLISEMNKLTGEEAVSKYGDKGKAGVIEITTKK